jgi:hypothetical protein
MLIDASTSYKASLRSCELPLNGELSLASPVVILIDSERIIKRSHCIRFRVFKYCSLISALNAKYSESILTRGGKRHDFIRWVLNLFEFSA